MSIDDAVSEKKYSSAGADSDWIKKIHHREWKSWQDAGSEDDYEILQFAGYSWIQRCSRCTGVCISSENQEVGKDKQKILPQNDGLYAKKKSDEKSLIFFDFFCIFVYNLDKESFYFFIKKKNAKQKKSNQTISLSDGCGNDVNTTFF